MCEESTVVTVTKAVLTPAVLLLSGVGHQRTALKLSKTTTNVQATVLGVLVGDDWNTCDIYKGNMPTKDCYSIEYILFVCLSSGTR